MYTLHVDNGNGWTPYAKLRNADECKTAARGIHNLAPYSLRKNFRYQIISPAGMVTEHSSHNSGPRMRWQKMRGPATYNTAQEAA